MAAKAKQGKLNVELERALAEEVKEICRKHKEDVWDGEGDARVQLAKKGGYVYGVLDRMRVYDKALKLESIKLKADDPEWGAEFDGPKEGK